LNRIVGPLQNGSLPNKLTRLEISNYNIELQQGVLPQTTQYLSIGEYNQALNQHSLPPSLTTLHLPSFTGSFSSVGPLYKLSFLFIKSLDPSLSTLLQYVKDIYIEFQTTITSFENISLYNCTSIQSLTMFYSSYDYRKKLELPVKFFPLSLRYLQLENLHIKSTGVINDGCVSVVSSIHIDDSHIPSSVTIINNKKRYL